MLFFCCRLAIAQVEPNSGTLYRADTRGPDQIFAHGFSAWGANEDLGAHTRGESCSGTSERRGRYDSAYISTAADIELARWWAQKIGSLREYEFSYTYVYRIRSNEYTFNLQQTLQAYIPHARGLIMVAAEQSEWPAYRQIDSRDIIDVERYRQGRLIDTTPNPYYIPRNPFINDQPFVPALRLGTEPIGFTTYGSQVLSSPYAVLPTVVFNLIHKRAPEI
jgi:hypothetical protein